jgi:hypothetical protein
LERKAPIILDEVHWPRVVRKILDEALAEAMFEEIM